MIMKNIINNIFQNKKLKNIIHICKMLLLLYLLLLLLLLFFFFFDINNYKV